MKTEDRERIQVEVVSRVVQEFVQEARSRGSTEPLEALLQDTLYLERRRLEQEPPERVREELAFYADIQQGLRHAGDHDLRELLTRIARRFVTEVVGNFDPRVYRLATRALPPALTGLLTASSPLRLLSQGLGAFSSRAALADHLRVEGEVDLVRALLERGTLILLPTHSSNLDSIIIGYAAYLIGLPPLTYGAGLNLFTNPLISFFMRNLGAYRVDRKKHSAIYKAVLKEYATCSMELGYNNLFFPGGTRSRSGMVEQKLKLGLLGGGLRAYINNLRAGRPKPDIFVVPCTLSYMLVLEAETLIDDFLKETGKSRYIIEDDEFSQPRRIWHFFNNLIALDSRITVTFSRPLDVFGNFVDVAGRSLDARGRTVDPRRYVTREGEPVVDRQRDHQYTEELGEEVRRALLRDNVLMSTHLLGYALGHLLEQVNPGLDRYRLLRTGGDVPSFALPEVHQTVEELLRVLRQRAQETAEGPRFSPTLLSGDIQQIVAEGLKHFGLYHTRPAAVRRGDRIFHEDRNLLLYYGNRLRGYDLGRLVAAAPPRPTTTPQGSEP